MWNKLKQWLHPDHITRGSIKEGFDDLPAAVCYFTPDGIIRLCNRQMFRVYRALSGRDLQSLEELHQQVWAPTHGRRVDGKNPSFVLPDGTCWLYSEQTVFGEGVRPHVECIFSEVTDLQRQRQELLRQHQQLLLTIARECITNAVRYAGANRLEITITPQGGGQRWQFENDGPPPADPAITPGGGLTAIQRRVMQAGGTMEVQARPRYRLCVNLPKEETI